MKQVSYMDFERVPTRALVMGAGRELYKRFDTYVWAVIAVIEFSYIIFSKLG